MILQFAAVGESTCFQLMLLSLLSCQRFLQFLGARLALCRGKEFLVRDLVMDSLYQIGLEMCIDLPDLPSLLVLLQRF